MTSVDHRCPCAQPAVAAAPVAIMGPPEPVQYASAPVMPPVVDAGVLAGPPEPLPLPGAMAPNQPMAGVDAIGAPLPNAAPVAPFAPTSAPATPGTGAWLTAWPQALARLQQLGVPQVMIDSIGRQPMNEPELAQAVQDVELTLRGGQPTRPNAPGGQQSQVLVPLDGLAPAPKQSPVVPGRESGSVPNQAPANDAQAQSVAKAKQVLAQHAKSGMPQEILDVVAQNATSPEGLDATLTQIESRMDKVRADGWVDKFAKAGVSETDLWQLVLGGNPEAGTVLGPMPKDSDLDMALVMAQRGKAGWTRQIAEGLVSFIPGVQAAEYVAGTNVISGSDIRQYDGMNQILAGISAAALGVVALGKFHNAKTLMSGLKSARDGFAGLTGATGRELAAGSQGAKLADMASSGKLTFGKTFFNKELRGQVAGMGHIDAAAKARTGVGSNMDTIGRTISDDVLNGVASGQLTATTGKLHTRAPIMTTNRFMHTPKPTATMTDTGITFSTKARISNGTTQLAGVVKAGGDHMTTGSGYLADRLPALSAQMRQFSTAERDAAGEKIAALALHRTGKAGRDGSPAKELNSFLAQNPNSASLSWYHDALAATPAR